MRRSTLGSVALLLALWVTLVLPPMARAGIHVSLEPDSATVQTGDTVTVRLTIFKAESQFNAFDAFVAFDPARVEYVSAALDSQIGSLMSGACDNCFHRFVPHPDNVEIHLSFMCPSTFVTGPGEIYRVRLRVLPGDGPTDLVWRSGTEFYRAGFFVRPVESLPMTLFVHDLNGVGPPAAGAAGLSLETPRPNPYRGSGPATVKFWLAAPSRVGFVILDAQGRNVASRAPEEFSAGTHSFAWTGLRIAPGRYLVKMTSGTSGETARTWVVVR